jgi:hypothetical protein
MSSIGMYACFMDTAVLEDHRRQAEKHIAIGARLLEKQRELAAKLEQHGHKALAEDARKLLAEFEKILSMHVSDRDRQAPWFAFSIKWHRVKVGPACMDFCYES